MLKNLVVILVLLLSTGCSSLKPTPEAKSGGEAAIAAIETKQPDCDKLDSDYSVWGAVAKGLAVLAGFTPAAGVANGVAALVGASSAGVGYYADTRTQAYIKYCTKSNEH